MDQLGIVLISTITGALAQVVSYIPKFLGGLIILLIGLVISGILKTLVVRLFKYIKAEELLEQAGLGKAADIKVWPEILSEVVRWATIIIFLIPAFEAWGLTSVTELLNRVIIYIPNVIVAAAVGFVGLGVARLVFDVVKNAAASMGSDSANLLANIARYALVFFTALIVLNQLGVAGELVRILFTGIVAMLAIAGGLAFGLGGQGAARSLLEKLIGRLKK